MSRLGDAAWPEVGDGTVVAIPVGSCEQHGPHLPLATDTLVAIAVADRLAAQRREVTRAPAITFGASGEHQGFPGTLSIGTEALARVVIQLRRSADLFGGVVFVNGHGGNAEALTLAREVLDSEGRPTLFWSPRWTGDAHAGRTETSVMLALERSLVRLGAASAGNTVALAELLPRLRREGVRALSPTGVLGDPTGADETEGLALMDEAAVDLLAAYDRWRPRSQ
jgi:creatinine amidohydrolase